MCNCDPNAPIEELRAEQLKHVEDELAAVQEAAAKFFDMACAYRQALVSARSMLMNPEVDFRYAVRVIDDALE